MNCLAIRPLISFEYRSNKLIHLVCVPILLWTAFCIFSYHEVPRELIAEHVPAVAGLQASAEKVLPFFSFGHVSFIFATCYALFYLFMDIPLGMLALPLLGAGLLTAEMVAAEYGWSIYGTLWAVHGFTWVAQFYGHFVHEGRAPALLDNLPQSIFMAPLFVLMEFLMLCGFMRGFHEEVEKEVKKDIEAFKSDKGKKRS